MDGLCKGCRNGRKNSENGIYCRLFGIMIHRTHRGCKYFKEKENTDEIREPEGEDGGRHV